MRLLSKKSAQAEVKKQNDELIEKNIRLRQYEKIFLERMNTLKENYDPEKLKTLRDFETFCTDITEKKSKLLAELKALEKAIVDKKEIYYGLVVKQDELDEKIHQIRNEESKLNLRLAYVTEIEKKINERQLLVTE